MPHPRTENHTSTPLAEVTEPTRKSGTIRAAFAYRRFRILFIGTTLSSVGTWMQNFTLPAYIDARTESAAMVGLFVFALLGPLLFLSIPAGILSDRFNRTHLVVAMQVVMLSLSILIAVLVSRTAPLAWILLAQLGIGIANTLQAPSFNASMPMLVERADLPGAISANSAMINGSRIAGPSLAALLATIGLGVPQLLLVNAATYLFLIVPLLWIALPQPAPNPNARRGLAALRNGIDVARHRKVVRNTLLTMGLFSLFCLPYVGLFPSIARTNFGLDPEGNAYRLLYVVWGLGAFLGAVSVGTVFARFDNRRLVRMTLFGFAVTMTIFALAHDLWLVLPVALLLGSCYFMTATVLSTMFQQNLADDERGQSMPLWFMSFGGTVPIGQLIGGPILDAVGPVPLLLFSAFAALVLANVFNFARLGPQDFLSPERGGEPFTPVNASRFF